MSKENFYQNLPAFRNFSGITENANFRTLPDNWTVIVADVRNSTIAVEEGRYKDVNTIGAGAISCAKSAAGTLQIPFVFGGDGASLVVPPSVLEPVKRRLAGLRALAREQFDLELRVGAVPVTELTKDGAVIEVAKFEIVPGQTVAIFRGGGITRAEEKIKNDAATYQISDESVPSAALDGISCRWQPLPARRGSILSMLVLARVADPDSVYRNLLERLNSIFDGDLDGANPVNVADAKYRTAAECYRDEKRYHSSRWSLSFFSRSIEILLATAVFRLGVRPFIFDPKHYADSMRTHSDYRKFDDMLRMIVDCTEAQGKQIRELFETLRQKGAIYYGIHESSNALMTCYVEDLRDGHHIHFIDGGDGGYTLAALQLKKQMKD